MSLKRFFWILAGIAAIWLGSAFSQTDRHFEIAKSLEIFASVYREVNHYYVDEVSPTDLAKDAIFSMLASLDPYTNYIPEDQIEDYRTMTTGEYGGIGADVERKEGKLIIVKPLKGYPAAKAGLRIGDEIVEVNGLAIRDRDASQVEKMLKGQSGEQVRLLIKRPGKEQLLSFSVAFEKVRELNVPYYGMVTSDIGLIKLSDFTQKAGMEVRDALIDLKGQGATKIILDLRGNPGGLLNEAVNISNLFLPKGVEIVNMRGRSDEWSKNYQALNEPVDLNVPLALLIDSNSASASEIVAGSLQDFDRGVLVGQRSFGKGLVQTTTPLSFNSQLKVTVAKYYIPSGRCIQEIDYSHRDANGTPDKTDNIQRKPFLTRGGRTVYDGAGIDPDILTELPKLAPITQSLLANDLIFEYANWYRNQRDSIPSPQTFTLSEQEYAHFTNWVKGKHYAYRTKVEETLAELVASAKQEKYYEDIASQIGELEKQVSTNKDGDLAKFKEEIKEILEREIATRYYMEVGTLEATFDDNPDILAAIDILNNPDRYKKILTK